MRPVTVADLRRSEGKVSCFTLATVGVIGIVLTGTVLVSAVTVLVSAFTLDENLGDAETQVTDAVQVSVTIFNSDLTLKPTIFWLLGALGGGPPLTRLLRSVLPVFHAWMGTWILFFEVWILIITLFNLAALLSGSITRLGSFFIQPVAALHSNLRMKRPTFISEPFLHFLLKGLIFFR